MTQRVSTPDGVELNLVTWEVARPRAALAIVHGAAEHIGRYQEVGEHLADRDIATIGVDLRGHGQSAGPRFSVADFDEFLPDIDLLLEQARVRHPGVPVFVLGHSMGGLLTLLAGARGRLDGVAGVVLSAAAVQMADPVPAVLRGLVAVLSRIAPGVPLAKIDASTISRDPDVVAAYENDPLVIRSGMKAGTARAFLAAQERALELAPSFTHPVLLVHGGDDALIHADGSRLLMDRIGSPDKLLTVYPGLYHEVLNEPEGPQVLADILAWIDARC